MAGPKSKNAAAKAEGPKTEGNFEVVVFGPAKGRWRIGRHFGAGGTRIPTSELSEAEIEALRNDPELVVAGATPAASPELVRPAPDLPAPDLPAPDLPDPAST